MRLTSRSRHARTAEQKEEGFSDCEEEREGEKKKMNE